MLLGVYEHHSILNGVYDNFEPLRFIAEINWQISLSTITSLMKENKFVHNAYLYSLAKFAQFIFFRYLDAN
jgi:hypothetical protein